MSAGNTQTTGDAEKLREAPNMLTAAMRKAEMNSGVENFHL